jgi:hypothetical protein
MPSPTVTCDTSAGPFPEVRVGGADHLWVLANVEVDALEAVAPEIWDMMLGLPIAPVDHPGPFEEGTRTITGLVTIVGEWSGAVTLETTTAAARAFAAAMFGADDPDEMPLEEVRDAHAELVLPEFRAPSGTAGSPPGDPGSLAARGPLLRHHAHLLRQRRAAHRARVHDGDRRRDQPLAPAARRRRLFLTGTDEHGLKVQRRPPRTASARRSGPTARGRALPGGLATIDISNDDFIRTTEPRHYRAVEQLLQACFDAGDIELGEYQGWYSVSDEEYITEDEVEEYRSRGRKVIEMAEPNYFFRLSRFGQRLLDWYEAHPDAIHPETRRNEVLGFIKQGLRDFSISRTSLTWGIPLPWDPAHVTYVWFDALTNYITAAGYGSDDPQTPNASPPGGRARTSSARTSSGSTACTGRRCCCQQDSNPRRTGSSTVGCSSAARRCPRRA